MTSALPTLDAPLHLLDEPPPAASVVPTVLEADVFPDATAAWAAQAAPGSATVVPLAAIAAGALSAEGQIDALVAYKRAEAWMAAQRLRLLGEIARTRRDVLGKDYTREEVAAAMDVSPQTAAGRLSLARSLRRHPRLLDGMGSGTLTEMHAKVFVDETQTLDDAEAAAVEDRVLSHAAAGTVGRFRKQVRRAVLSVAAKTAEQRHLEARGQRTVEWCPLPDGMEGIWTVQPAEISAAMRARVEAEVATIPAIDPRTTDQRRADAYANLVLTGGTGTGSGSGTDGVPLPGRHGLRPGVHVTVAASTLLGLDEQPGELAGYGPIPASLARQIAADPSGTWRRIVTDGVGRLIDYGRSTYRPPAELARHVIARDVTCCFPNCSKPAMRCEIDHCLDWGAGGETKHENLVVLCSRHHHLKHDTAWHYQLTDDGRVIWTSPTGHTYVRPAATYPIENFEFHQPPPLPPPPTRPEPPPQAADPPF